MPTKRIIRIVFCLLIFLVVAFFRIRAVQHVNPWQSPDTKGYIQQARGSIFSTDFFLGHRGFTIPLLYKIAGIQIDRIVWFQALASLLCGGALGFALLKSISNHWIGLAAFGLAMVFGMGREIIVWDAAILSESFSLSLLALTLAFALLLIAKWTKTRLAVLLVTALLWIFARDTNAFVLGMAAITILLIAFSREYRKRSLMVGIPLLAISVIALTITAVTGRFDQSLTTNFTQRILNSPAREAYFIEKGMPISRAVQNEAGRWDYRLLKSTDPDITRFREWMLKNGKYIYLQFLIAHPKILFGEPAVNRNQLIAGGEYLFILPAGFNTPPAWQQITDITYSKDLTLFIIWVLSTVGLAAIAAPRKKDLKKLLFPCLLILLCIPAAIVIWHSNIMEVERHALLIGVQFHLGLWLLFLFSADVLVTRKQPGSQLP